MLKKVNNFMNILMGCSIGVFIGSAIFKYLDYKKYPDLYVVQSAPWYLSIQINGIALICALIICVVIKVIIKKKQK
ncbi:MAG: hypothetical protein PHQ72_09345 [Hespellia sp.]|nr:hypothetical protein [Hespellia sp.]